MILRRAGLRLVRLAFARARRRHRLSTVPGRSGIKTAQSVAFSKLRRRGPPR